MRNIFRTIAVILSLAMTGCAIHPLPEDVTGVPTYLIARKVRCEARAGLKENLTQWLKVVPNDPAANKIGRELESAVRPLNTFSDNWFQGPVKDIVQKFANSAIAYNSTFDITE